MDKTLGLAFRAKKVLLGTDLVVENLRKGKINLIFLASDASFNTIKKINDKATTYKTLVIQNYDTKFLSNAIGLFNVKVLGITDKGFSELLKKKI